MTDVVPRKRPWELHAIVALFAIAIGALVTRWQDLLHPFFIGITVCIVGLFRGNRVAWWATALAFAILAFSALWKSGETLQSFGLHTHPKLLRIHASTLVALAPFLLLVICWYRGAIPPRAAPVLDELPAAGKVIAVTAPIIFILAAVFGLSIVLLSSTSNGNSERNAHYGLKILSSAEADFRSNDRDENLINDFWTGDVQGLYSVVGAKHRTPVKLITLSIAVADGAPLVDAYPPLQEDPCPKGGVAWFTALIEDRSVNPPEPYGPRHPSKFGFLTYPDNYIIGPMYAYIVNENNAIFRRALTGDIRPGKKVPPGPLQLSEFTGWPSDAELKVHWKKLR